MCNFTGDGPLRRAAPKVYKDLSRSLWLTPSTLSIMRVRVWPCTDKTDMPLSSIYISTVFVCSLIEADVYFSLPYLNCSTIRLQEGDLTWEEILNPLSNQSFCSALLIFQSQLSLNIIFLFSPSVAIILSTQTQADRVSSSDYIRRDGEFWEWPCRKTDLGKTEGWGSNEMWMTSQTDRDSNAITIQ